LVVLLWLLREFDFPNLALAETTMKLIDLIELLFKPAPVQFEPVAWRGPMPERWCVSAGMAYKVPTNWRAVYSDGWAEIVSPARVVSVPAGRKPLLDAGGKIVGWVE
jgi:hypothetical protein